MDEAIDNADPRMQGVKASEISPRKALRMMGPGGRPLALFDNDFPGTPSGKVELASETMAKRWGEAARLPSYRPRDHAKFPLALISPASDKRISSTLLGAGGTPDEAPPLFMNPRDAAARRLNGAKRVRVWNERGAVILPLQVTEAVAPGVVASEKGAWLATSPTGNTISALVSAELRADIGQGACFNDTAVEVEAA
jgi:anaerobic selenocysteine-containing dehydrogenase